jgi:hypothetical protein
LPFAPELPFPPALPLASAPLLAPVLPPPLTPELPFELELPLPLPPELPFELELPLPPALPFELELPLPPALPFEFGFALALLVAPEFGEPTPRPGSCGGAAHVGIATAVMPMAIRPPATIAARRAMLDMTGVYLAKRQGNPRDQHFMSRTARQLLEQYQRRTTPQASTMLAIDHTASARLPRAMRRSTSVHLMAFDQVRLKCADQVGALQRESDGEDAGLGGAPAQLGLSVSV